VAPTNPTRPWKRHPRLDRHLNTDPKPYVWTKTADEILERLTGYLNKIPGSDH
jgi:hypothetical protein